jgi:hypothetical protein
MAEMERERTLGQPAALAQGAIDQEAANARLGKVTGFQSAVARGALSALGVTTEGEQGRELSGYLTRKVGETQRSWLGDRQLIAERAAGLPRDSAERQMIIGTLKSTDVELQRQRLGETRFEAARIMGIREEGPLFRERAGRIGTPDSAADVQLKAAERQEAAAREMKEVSSSMLQFARMLGTQTTSSPIISPDTSRRAQVQNAIPAE